MLELFVSIINFNNSRDTVECLRSISEVKIEGFNLTVVIVDNASKEIFKLGKNSYKNFKVKIIRSESNLGFSGGHNLGIKYSLENNADYIVILNNDVIIAKDIFINLLDTFKEKNNCSVVSPKIYFAKGYEFHKDRYSDKDLGKVIWYAGGETDWENVMGKHIGVDEVDRGQYDILSQTDFASGCCMMVKREVFEKIGFLDEKYFLYYEDNDFSQRAKKYFKIYYQPKAILWHKNAGSTGGVGSNLQDYYISRNRLLFGFRYALLRSEVALIRESIRILVNGRKWQKRGVIDYYLGKFGKGSYE